MPHLAPLALVAGLVAGAGIGYVAKRPVTTETRFLNFDVESTPSDTLGEGWSNFEATPGKDTFAWCTRASCTLKLNLPNRADRVVRLRVFPFRYPGAPPQTAKVVLNGKPVTELAVPDGPSVLSFGANRDALRPGTNWLRFDFAYAESPQRRTPPSEDPRTLSVAFDWVEVIAR